MNTSLGPGQILWHDLSNKKGTSDLVGGMLGACIWQAHLKAAARELARYKLDLVGVQKFWWKKGGMVRAGDYNFFLWKMN
jgi:hypothetical protein